MKAIIIEPKKPGTGRCENIPEPNESEGSILGEAVAVGDAAATEVLKNNVLAGSVHANKRHWYKASERLARLDRKWLNRMIRRRETPENFGRAP